jgi:glutamate synthase (NADPH/NADH) small chain
VHNLQKLEPIPIGRLQRYATDRAVAAGWTFFEAGAPTGKSVGVIGGGPAGLACAHELRRFGHAVTIYEKRAHLGGLNATGIAPYKLKSDAALAEVDWVLRIGGIAVELHCDVASAQKLSALDEQHDAVFVGVGLGTDTPLAGAPGADLPGVIGAVDWIERIKLGHASVAGVQNAVVIGGGNTAMDVVRELAGLDVPRVTLVYRGTEQSMSGYAHEWQAAEVAGVRAEWRTQPTGFVGDGKLQQLRVVRLDESRHAIAGSEHLLDADLAILAIGQSTLGAHLAAALPGVVLERGAPKVAADRSLGRPGWFAGGDFVVAHEVVNAVADGKRAAQSIDAYLKAGAAS